jgi:hypothetical protein
MTKGSHNRVADADRASAAAETQQTGCTMPNIRTANRRHKRTIVANLARAKAAERAAIEVAEPAKSAE